MPRFRFLLPLLLFFLIPPAVYAQTGSATLSLSPSSSSVKVDQSFTVAIKVTSATTNISSVQSYLTFPADLLEVSSISKTGSIASLFVEEPIYNNTSGTIKMTADIASPGYKGSDGLIATVTFRAKANGSANVGFTTEAAVYPTSGTSSILGTSDTGSYTIGTGSASSSTTPTVTPTKVAAKVTTAPASGTALPSTATTGQTGLGILFGLSLIAVATYLKISKKTA